jgi:hypothetical protein
LAYRSIDTRALSAFRIAMGLLCIADILRRTAQLEQYYLPSGWVPAQPEIRHTFTLLDLCASPAQAYGLSAFALVSALLFTVGYRTRIAHGVTWICLVSFHSSRFPTVNTGDLVMHLFMMWTLWLPLGRHWSIDAVRRRQENLPSSTTVTSLAVTACWLQFATIYGFNAIEKWGPNWHNGEALYYVMQLDMYATPLALALRDWMSIEVSSLLTGATLVIEFLAPVLILSPVAPTRCRRLAALLLAGLHLGIALVAEIGLFPYVMLATFTLLIFPTPEAPDLCSSSAEGPDESPLLGSQAKRRVVQGCIAMLLLINTIQGMVSHDLPRELLRALGVNPKTPAVFRDVVYFGHMTQRWRLFAPSVPAGEGRLVLDATTREGKHIDPMTGQLPDFGPSSARAHPFDQHWRKYSARAKSDDSGAFAQKLSRWWLERDHDLVSLDVYWIYDRSPEPGATSGPEVIRKKHLGGLKTTDLK